MCSLIFPIFYHLEKKKYCKLINFLSKLINFIIFFRIRDKELQHTHHLKDDLGREGKYRRTSSPTICSTPNVRPTSVHSTTNSQISNSQSQNNQIIHQNHKSQIKSPARTPKRDSPATIAAKGKQYSAVIIYFGITNFVWSFWLFLRGFGWIMKTSSFLFWKLMEVKMEFPIQKK